MTDESNVDEVMKGSIELEKTFKKFQGAHEAFHSYLEDPLAIEESSNYYELIYQQVDRLQQNVDIWLAGIRASNFMKSFDVNSEDSMSNVGLRSFTSCSSHALWKSRSLPASAKARAVAKRAILKAEAATLRWLHEIEEEELKLRQCKN